MLFALSLGLVSCGKTEVATADGKRRLTLQTNWAPQPEDGGFYQASLLGFYEEEGLEVDIKPAAAGMNIYSYVAAGEAEFGISVLAKLLVAIDRGLPLVAVANYRPASLRVLLLHEDDPARSFPDLDGRVIKARGEDLWLAYLKDHYNLNLKVIPHDFGLGQFLADRSLVQQGLLTSEPYTLREKGVPVRVLELKDAGWENLEVIFCHRDLVESDPELVAGLARASIKGWQSFLTEDAEQTLQWISKENPARSLDSMAWAKSALAAQYDAMDEEAKDRFGVIDAQKVQSMIDTLVELEAIDRGMTVEQVVFEIPQLVILK